MKLDSIKPVTVGAKSPNKQTQVSLPEMQNIANGMALSISFSSILGDLLNSVSVSQPATAKSVKEMSAQDTTSTEYKTHNAPDNQQNVNNVQQTGNSEQASNQSDQNTKVVENKGNQVQQQEVNQQPTQEVNQQPNLQGASQNTAIAKTQVNAQEPVSAQANNQPLIEIPIKSDGLVLLHVNRSQNEAGIQVATLTGDTSSKQDATVTANVKNNAVDTNDLATKLNVSQVVVNPPESVDTGTSSNWKALDNLTAPLNLSTSTDIKQVLPLADKADAASQQVSALTWQNPLDVLTAMNFASVNYSMSDLAQSFKEAVPQNQVNAINSAGDAAEVAALGVNSGGVSQTSFQGNVTQSGVNMQERIEFIQNMIKAANVADTDGQSRLKMVLNPPELGNLKVDLSMKDKVLNGSFKVDSESAKELVMSHLGNLKSALEEHGIKMGDFNVNVQQGLEHQNSQSFESQNFNQAHYNPQVDGNYWQETKPVDESSSRSMMPRASTRLQVIDVLA